MSPTFQRPIKVFQRRTLLGISHIIKIIRVLSTAFLSKNIVLAKILFFDKLHYIHTYMYLKFKKYKNIQVIFYPTDLRKKLCCKFSHQKKMLLFFCRCERHITCDVSSLVEDIPCVVHVLHCRISCIGEVRKGKNIYIYILMLLIFLKHVHVVHVTHSWSLHNQDRLHIPDDLLHLQIQHDSNNSRNSIAAYHHHILNQVAVKKEDL